MTDDTDELLKSYEVINRLIGRHAAQKIRCGEDPHRMREAGF